MSSAVPSFLCMWGCECLENLVFIGGIGSFTDVPYYQYGFMDLFT